MEPLISGALFFALYKATEKIWGKVFDAAWEPLIGERLKALFTRWAGKDKEALRQEAFARAVEIAQGNTLRSAVDRQQAGKILCTLNSGLDTKRAEALAEEAAKLMLFSASPDVPRLTELCNRTLHWKALFGDETPPPPEAIAIVLSVFLTNLREALLDQEPYHDLVQREMLRAMRDIVKELRPLAYDNESTYRYQISDGRDVPRT